MELTVDEQAWLRDFQRALQKNYPGLVEDLVIFRADDAQSYVPDYALNTVVVLKECDLQTRKAIERLGFQGTGLSDVMPFIWVYNQAECKQRRNDGMLPYLGDGTSVWSSKSWGTSEQVISVESTIQYQDASQ